MSSNYVEEQFAIENYDGVIKYYLENKIEKKEIEKIEIMAECYAKTDDFFRAIDYYEKAIKLNKEVKNQFSLLSNYISIAVIHKKIRKKEHYKIAIDYLLKAVSITKRINVNIETKSKIHNNIANNYKRLKKRQSALFHHKKALELSAKKNDSIKIAMSYSNIAALYLNVNSSKKDLNKAEHYIIQSLKYNSKPHYSLFLNLGIVNYLKKDYTKSLKNHNKAIEILLSIKLSNDSNLPEFDAIKNSNKKENLLNILFEKAYSCIKLGEKDKNDLSQGIKIIELSDQLLDLLFIETKEEKTKVYWRRRASKFYFLGVHLSHLLNNNEKAFYFTEKNKALLLLNNTILVKQNQNVNIPESIKKKEISLKKEIYSLENILSNRNKKDSLKSILFEKRLEFETFSKSLKTRFPNYINNNVMTKVLSITEVQNQIKDTSICYISYIWNKSENQFNALYGIAITKNSTRSFKINGLRGFNKTVTKFKRLVTKPFVNDEDKKNYEEVAHLLYSNLFPLEIRPLIKNKKLIIIPDSDLSNISFEALITNSKNNNFLIESNEISYAYSVSFLAENNNIKRLPKKEFISYAPNTFNHSNLPPLLNNINETNAIAKILNGEAIKEKEATKQHFFSTLNNYKIIHLSTHADANDSIAPWIAFKNTKLHLSELYTAKNQANLVVLNTCKSSLGNAKEGEGIFSLARGFFYSGSKSVISSLWNVNDKSNASITSSFYNYLKKGKTKSVALRQAKLDYINTHSLSELSPYYWSSLILIGDDAAIYPNYNMVYYFVFFVLLIILLFFILKKIKIVGNKY